MKPDIILLHGYRGGPSGLKEISIDLEKAGYKTHLPSVPPFGDSSPLKSYDRDNYADFVADFIKKNNLQKPIIIGHSMGSMVAAATAEKYPDLINDKLIFLSPISNTPPRPIAALNPLITVLPHGFVDVTTTAYNMIPNGLETAKKTMRLTREVSKKYTTIDDVKLAGEFSIKNAVPSFNFKKNVLFIAGKHDHLISPKHTKALAEKLGKKMKSKAIFIPGTGHLLNYEKPHETASEIIKFLEVV